MTQDEIAKKSKKKEQKTPPDQPQPSPLRTIFHQALRHPQIQICNKLRHTKTASLHHNKAKTYQHKNQN